MTQKTNEISILEQAIQLEKLKRDAISFNLCPQCGKYLTEKVDTENDKRTVRCSIDSSHYNKTYSSGRVY